MLRSGPDSFRLNPLEGSSAGAIIFDLAGEKRVVTARADEQARSIMETNLIRRVDVFGNKSPVDPSLTVWTLNNHRYSGASPS